MQFIMLYVVVVKVCDEYYAVMLVRIAISIQFKRAVDTQEHKAVDAGAGVPALYMSVATATFSVKGCWSRIESTESSLPH
jgi:hypothetical protein